MKTIKFLFILFCYVLVVTGCGNSDEPSNNVVENGVEESLDVNSGELENEDTGAEQEEIESATLINEEELLGLTIDNITHILEPEVENINFRAFDYGLDKRVYYASLDEYENVRVICFTGADTDYLENILCLLGNQSKDSVALANWCYDEILSICDDNILEYSITDDYINGKYIIYPISFGANKDYINLPIVLSELTDKDFFSSEERCELYSQYYKSGKYNELYDLLNGYISEESPSESDSVYMILEVIEPIMEVFDDCFVKYDESEDKATIFYNGVTEINANTCFVPQIGADEKSMTVAFGFQKSDWLFFDNFSIKLDSGDIFSKKIEHYDINRDVIGAGIIQEWDSRDLSWLVYGKDMEALINSDRIEIRFANTSNNEVYDHVLSDNEMAALKTIYKFDGVRNVLSDTLFRHSN